MMNNVKQEGFEKVSDFCWYIDRQAETTYCFFSGINAKKGKFGFFNLAQRFNNANIILLNAATSKYYTDGIPGLGKNIHASARRLRSLLLEFNSKKVVMVGSSMGANGAIHFSFFIPEVTDVIGFGPELSFGIYGGIVSNYFDQSEIETDPIETILTNESCNYVVFVGDSYITDLVGACRLEEKKPNNATIICVKNAFHDLASTLHKRHDLYTIIQMSISNERPDYSFLGLSTLLQATELVELIYRMRVELLDADFATVNKVQALLQRPTSTEVRAHGSNLLGHLLMHLGDKHESLAAFKNAAECSEYNILLFHDLIRTSRILKEPIIEPVQGILQGIDRLSLSQSAYRKYLHRIFRYMLQESMFQEVLCTFCTLPELKTFKILQQDYLEVLQQEMQSVGEQKSVRQYY